MRSNVASVALSAIAVVAIAAFSIASPIPALPAAPIRPESAARAAQAIQAPEILATIRFLSSDLLEGRGPGGRGDELARTYLASELEAAGLEPGAADGSYQQKFEMVGVKSHAPESWAFTGGKGATESFHWFQDYIAASGVQEPGAAIDNAEVVFVGYGIVAPEYGWDDYKGVDVKGKILLMMNNDPDWDPKLFAGTTRLFYGRWVYKYEIAAAKGAVGAIIIHTTASAGYPFQVVQTSWGGEQFRLPAGDEPKIQVSGWMTEESSARLAKLGGFDLAKLVESARSKSFKPVPLGVTTSIRLTNDVRRITTANVAGLLRGSDPKLKDEVVVYSAHHDHLGVGEPDKKGDRIYNGAVDNASGCAQILAAARAFAAAPERPKRSILFLFVAAEEQGLLGSAYYAKHPTFAPGRIAANINLDAGNVFGRTRDVTYVGYGKSSLDQVIEAAAGSQGRVVKGDQFPDRGSFYRSDQFNFAKIGVPALYIDGGTDFIGKDPEFGKKMQETYESTCYHQPCDEIRADWDLSGMVEDTRLAFLAGSLIADAPAMPAWKPGDEFEATRKRALAAAP